MKVWTTHRQFPVYSPRTRAEWPSGISGIHIHYNIENLIINIICKFKKNQLIKLGKNAVSKFYFITLNNQSIVTKQKGDS